MIEWGNLYFRPEQIVMVRMEKSIDGWRVSLCTVNNGSFYCDYKTLEEAERARRRIAAQMERADAAGAVERMRDDVVSRLSEMRAGIGLLDKRQRKLWRQLKELLPEIGEENTEP